MPLRRDSMKKLPEDVFAEPSAPIPGGVNDQAPTGPSRPSPDARVEEPRELALKNSEVENSVSAGEVKLDDHSSHEPLAIFDASGRISSLRPDEWVDDVHDQGTQNGMQSPEHQDAAKSAGKSASPPDNKIDRFKKYLSPISLEDPQEIKRQIRFKKQIIKTLREHCDREIELLDEEVQTLEQKLEAKRRPLIGKLNEAKLQEQADKKNGSTGQSKGSKGSLYDDFQAAIHAHRKRLVASGVASSHQEIEEDNKKSWWRNREVVDKKVLSATLWAAVFGMLGCACGMIQNEMVFQEVDPADLWMDMLKVVNSFCTVSCLLIIYRYYWLSALIFRLNRHCRRLVKLDTSISFADVASSWGFWFEVFIVGAHCPPFFTSEHWTESLGNIVVYRIETLAALLNTMRIYLVFRWLRDLEFSKMAKRHTIATFAGAKFNNVYVFKRWLHGWNAILFLTSVWILCIFLEGYWFRAAEVTACFLKTTKMQEICSQTQAREWVLYARTFEHVNQYYIWDSLWLMYITTASIGYGDYTPKTHMGRFCAGVVAIQGMLLGALLIAAIMENLEWTPNELSTLRILERFKAKEQLKDLAIGKLKSRMRQIVNNSRKKKRDACMAQASSGVSTTTGRPRAEYKTGLAGLWEACLLVFSVLGLSTKLMIYEGQELTGRLRELQRYISKDLGDLQPDDAKFDRLHRRIKYIEKAVKSIHERLEEGDFVDSLIGAQSRRLEVQKSKTKNAQHNDFLGMLQKLERRELRSSGTSQKLSISMSVKGSPPSTAEKTPAPTTKWLKVQRLRNEIKKMTRGSAVTEFLQTQREAEKNVAVKVLEAMKEVRDWSRDKTILSRNLYLANIALAFVGCLGTCLSLVQNEMVIMGYGSVLMLDFCKTFNSICSLICVLLLVYIYWMNFLLKAVLAHIHQFRELRPPLAAIGDILSNPLFYLECLLCGLHCPPGLEYQYAGETLGNFLVYRIETVFSSLNLLRIYLLWRAFADYMLADLPKRHTLAGFSRVKLGAAYIMKRMMHSWYAFFYMAFGYILACLLFGYWYRNAELTACQFVPMPVHRGANITTILHPGCFNENARMWNLYGVEFEKVNDVWLQNNVWLMFVTATTVGYGETWVTTHLGRLIASAAGIAGLIFAALITASLGELLKWTTDEAQANHLLEREDLRLRIQVLAVKIIYRWWKRCQRRVAKIEISDLEAEEERHAFLNDSDEMRLARVHLFSLVDDAATDADKLDDVLKKTDHCEVTIELIAFELWNHDIPELIKMHARWEEESDKSKSNFYTRRLFNKIHGEVAKRSETPFLETLQERQGGNEGVIELFSNEGPTER